MRPEWPPSERRGEVSVLHVDDDRAFLDVTAAMIERESGQLRVTSLDDPTAVLSHVETETVDCVVSDYDMPEMNGLELLEAVRKRFPDLPFILFTGKGSEAVASEAISAGVTDYVQKTGDSETIEMLCNRIENAVEHARTEERLAYESSLLDTLFERIPHHLYVKDEEARHLRVSHAHIDEPEQLLGKTDRELYPEEHAADTYEDDMRVIRDGEPIIHKEEHTNEGKAETHSFDKIYEQYEQEPVTDKQRYDEWALTSKVPWRDDDGEIAGLIGITLDISDRKHYEESLERHSERLEEFLAQVVHDLRSPLQVADSNLALLREEGLDADRLDSIERAHGQIGALVDDLSRFARHGEMEPDPEPVDLEALVERIWERHESVDATLSVGSLPEVVIDRTDVRRLLTNLVDNAVDHSTPGVRISVGSLDDAGDGGIFVADDGPGLPSDDPGQVFEAGYTTASDGTGLGLSIVETIADRHGWEVVTTESDTGGARFELRF
ncbi:hybrid sensor histidine kinase/response regulator [Haloarcula sp. GH36]|uniref:hybrid sensor histidine kinase/response regulator n=1 Tax=Haloarcula montana TaxID=3111776 RepID=UPI002D790F1D|nr:response regulator [Haloarcula sp. GH36]